LPQLGYARLFENIFDHKNITLHTGQSFHPSLMSGFQHCFSSMPIDEFFGQMSGPLPYRSIRFHHREVQNKHIDGSSAVVNYTDSGLFTRQTDWSQLPFHEATGEIKTVTREEPCDYIENNLERYYPVKTSDGRFDTIYQKYVEKSKEIQNLTFIGRCGTYQYLDMHQVISQSLSGSERWIRSR
jgi:UDP-galactopyranose mutase